MVNFFHFVPYLNLPIQLHSPTGVMVRVRRSHILYDGMAALDKVGTDIKDRVVVRYLNNFGEEEAGMIFSSPLVFFSFQDFIGC